MSGDIVYGIKIKTSADGAGLKDTNAQLKETDRQLKQVGMSAKQTAFAMRQVPMQFTDIVTSLSSGQSAMQVFMQQGGQLKDIFGGAVPAARALGGYVAGLINPLTLGAAAAIGLATAIYQGAEQSRALNNVIALTGGIAGKTASEINAMAESAGALSGSYGSAREALMALAETGKFSGNQLDSALQGVMATSQATGQAAADVVKQFVAIKDDPVKAIKVLNDSYNFLTLDVYKQIASLQEQGRTQEATTLALETFSKAMEDRKGQVLENLGAIEKGWKSVKEWASVAWDAMLGIGREETIDEQIAKKAQILLANRNYVSSGVISGDTVANQEKELADLRRQKATAEFLAKEVAAFRAKQAEGIAAADDLKKYMGSNSRYSGAGLIAKQIEDENQAFAKATRGLEKNSADYQNALKAHQTAIANINAAGGKKAADTVKAHAEEYVRLIGKASEFAQSQQLELQQGDKLTQGQRMALAVMNDLVASKTKYSDSEKIHIGVMLEAGLAAEADIAQKKAQKEAEEALAKAQEEHARMLEQSTRFANDEMDAVLASTQSIEERIVALRKETEEIGLSESALAVLRETRYEESLAALESSKALVPESALREELVLAIDNQIDALQRLHGEELANISAKSAMEAAKRWEDASKDIRSNLTDAILRGFESGKGFASNFLDTLKNMFKTLILRPTIEFFTKPIAGGIASLLGSGSALAAGESGGIPGIGGILSGADSVLDVFSNGFQSMNDTFINSISGLGTKLIDFGFDGIGNAIASNASAIANIAPFAGAAFSLLKGDMKGAIASGLGAALSFTPLGPVGGLIGSALGSVVGGLFGKKKIPRVGARSLGSYHDGEYDQVFLGKFGDKAMTEAYGPLSELTKTLTTNMGMLLGAFNAGSEINANMFFSKRSQTRGSLSMSADGVNLINPSNDGNEGNKFKDFQSYADAVLGRYFVIALNNSALPAAIKSIFDGAEAKEDVAGRINAVIALKNAHVDLDTAYGLTVEQAAQVVRASANTGEQITAMVQALVGASSAAGSAGARILEIKASLAERYAGSGGLPETIKAFDAALKAMDKSGPAGIQAFADMLSLRGEFGQFVAAMDGLKNSVKGAVFELSTDAEKAAFLQADLARVFAEFNLAVPASAQELVLLGNSIDYTTEAGLNLASAFPALVQAFNQTQDAVAAAGARAAEIAAEAAARAAAIAEERYGLEGRLLELQGNTQALRQRELSTLDASNRGLQEQIWAMEDAAIAAERQAQLDSQAAEAAQQAADRIRDAWQGIADSVLDEVDRLRGKIAGNSAASLSRAQSAFAIATAQARAGDQTAASSLSGLSQQLDDLYKINSRSTAEYQLNLARNAASLLTTAEGMKRYGVSLPGFAGGGDFAGGWRVVGEKGPELEATGPARIFNADQTTRILSGGDIGQLRAEIQKMTEQLERAVEKLQQVERNTNSTAKAVNGQPDAPMRVRTV